LNKNAQIQRVKLSKAKMFKWKLGNLSDIKNLINFRISGNYLFIIELLKTQLIKTIWQES
jgi:hypothetical protein